MNLTQTCIDLIDERGPQTVDSLLPLLAGEHITCTRQQVKVALSNSHYLKRLVIVGKVSPEGRTLKHPRHRLSLYAVPCYDQPAPRTTTLPRVSSVFDLGAALERACL